MEVGVLVVALDSPSRVSHAIPASNTIPIAMIVSLTNLVVPIGEDILRTGGRTLWAYSNGRIRSRRENNCLGPNRDMFGSPMILASAMGPVATVPTLRDAARP